MTMVGIVVSLFVTHFAFASEPNGCLSPGGAGKMLVDKNCECLKSNSCIKFKPKTFKPNYYDTTDNNGNRVFSNEEKVKLKESYDVFYKIMDLKASGLSDSDEIKELYIKLDKLNLDVRKSLLKNHAADYTEIKKGYQKGQEDRKKSKKKLAEKITDLINNTKTSVASHSDSENSKTTNTAIHTSIGSVSAKNSFVPNTSVITENSEDKAHILKNLNPDKLNRKEDDSLFDIITKSYMRSAYPKLLTP